MAEFTAIEEALQFIWALPLGIGKLFCVGGGFYVGIKGTHFISDLTKKK